MEVFITLNGIRVDGISSSYGPGSVQIEIPESHEVRRNPFVFKYENGQLIKDVAYQQEQIKIGQELEKRPSLEEEVQLLKKQNADLTFNLMMKGVI